MLVQGSNQWKSFPSSTPQECLCIRQFACLFIPYKQKPSSYKQFIDLSVEGVEKVAYLWGRGSVP